MQHPELIIGWQEWVSLPDLGIPAIRAKIDTGAQTSSIHAFAIEQFSRSGQPFVKFNLQPFQRNRSVVRSYEMPLLDKRTVKNSGGEKEKRPVIRTLLNIDGKEWQIELNLTNRDYMGFRMLLGREALQRHVMVHPGATYIHGKMSNRTAQGLYVASKAD